MTGNEYQKLAARTISGSMSDSDRIYHALFGMASEVGEIHGIHQKVFQGHPLSVEQLKKELGDVLWFVAEFCTAAGWELEDVMAGNIDKLRKRYPEGFEEEKSRNRAEGDT